MPYSLVCCLFSSYVLLRHHLLSLLLTLSLLSLIPLFLPPSLFFSLSSSSFSLHFSHLTSSGARIGAPHSVVFAGFSSHALSSRIQDASCKVVITADEGRRGGRCVPLKSAVDEALLTCPSVSRVIVKKHTGGAGCEMKVGRDIWYDEAVSAERAYCPPEWMDSEDILFLLYTSGSTGAPKGLVHTQAGYLLLAAMTHKYVFDARPGDVYACVADVGWITYFFFFSFSFPFISLLPLPSSFPLPIFPPSPPVSSFSPFSTFSLPPSLSSHPSLPPQRPAVTPTSSTVRSQME